jgi:MATE family multidrug resistance protein
MISLAHLRREFRPMLALATPLALAELGWMAMGIVDTIMAGPLCAAAVGAGVLGNMMYYPIATSGVVLLLGMDTLVAQSHGAEDAVDCRRTLVAGTWLAVLLTLPISILILASIPLLRAAGTVPDVMAQCGPYMVQLLWSLLPLFLFTAFRRYLQAVDIVKPVTFSLISANLVNVLGNWIFIYGHWGMPRMGLPGSGLSSSIARVYMALVLLAAVLSNERRSGRMLYKISWRPDWSRIRSLVGLGLPAAGQIAFEGAVFGIVTILVARLDAVQLAAHGISVQVIATAFMVPLGISSAAAVRVGQAAGRKSPHGIAVSGWTALALAVGFMGTAGLALGIVPQWIARLYTPEVAVIAASAGLLRIAALFEIFDGLQVVATGALRGLGDTRTAAYAHLAGYWGLGLPVAYFLCFPSGWGVTGIWTGLTSALIAIGIVLLWAWKRRLGA